MLPQQVTSSIGRGILRASRARLPLRNQLSWHSAWLDDLFPDSSMPHAFLLPGGIGEISWRLVVVGRTGSLLQLGLSDELLESLGFAAPPRAGLRNALAECATASLMPALRDFFEQDVEVRVEEGRQGWPETDSWAKFQVAFPWAKRTMLARMVDAFAQKLHRLTAARYGRPRGDVALPLFAGTRQDVPASVALGLREGDVLLCEESSADAARQIRLYVMSASGRQQGRYLATLRRQDGRVDHLSPGPWRDVGWPGGGGTPRLGLDVVEARLLVSSEECRTLALGECLGGWPSRVWLETPEVRLGGRCLARARRITVAGRAGFEIIELQRPG